MGYQYWNLSHEKRIKIDEERRQKGIDGDLVACLENNPQPFDLADIKMVLAVWEGMNDEEDWRWVLSVDNHEKPFVFLQGGCDYTGWD